MSAFSEETYNQIEAYLEGSLTQGEKAEFEHQMESNEDLAQEVELVKRVDTMIRDQGALELQKTMNEIDSSFFEEEEEEESPKLRTSTSPRIIGSWTRRTWAIAASFLFFAIGALLIWQMQSNSVASGEELFAQYYETYDLNQTVRGDNDSSNVDLKKGIQQYQSKDFGAAVQTFLPLAAAQPQNDVAVFCLANAYLNQNPSKLNLAKQQFERITTNNVTIYVPKAQWYLALIALKEKDTSQAKVLLKEVVASGDDLKGKAEELLEELK